MFSQKEFNLGWEQGVLDAERGIHCRFEEGHSDYSDGYYGGYHYYLNRI